jgi:general stress protein YciG
MLPSRLRFQFAGQASADRCCRHGWLADCRSQAAVDGWQGNPPPAHTFWDLTQDRKIAMSESRTITNRGNFALDREKASRAGHVGGQKSSGNFANNRARAVEAGRKGGERSHGGGGAPNNPGNFAQDRERASEAGRKGGQHSHSGQQELA